MDEIGGSLTSDTFYFVSCELFHNLNDPKVPTSNSRFESDKRARGNPASPPRRQWVSHVANKRPYRLLWRKFQRLQARLVIGLRNLRSESVDLEDPETFMVNFIANPANAYILLFSIVIFSQKEGIEA